MKLKIETQSFFLIFLTLSMATLAIFLFSLFLSQQNKAKLSLPSKEATSPSDTKATAINSLKKRKKAPLLENEIKIEEDGQSFYRLAINLTEEENPVIAYQLELLFDPKTFKVEEIEKGGFIKPSLILEKTISNKEGKVLLSVGALPEEQEEKSPPSPDNNYLAVFYFFPKEEKNGKISFGPKTSLIGSDWYWENSPQALTPIDLFAKNK